MSKFSVPRPLQHGDSENTGNILNVFHINPKTYINKTNGDIYIPNGVCLFCIIVILLVSKDILTVLV